MLDQQTQLLAESDLQEHYRRIQLFVYVTYFCYPRRLSEL